MTIATKVLCDAAAALIAADTGTLAPAADKVRVHLIMAEFAPGLQTDFAALTPATFTGSTFKEAGVGTQQMYVDPETGEYVVQLLEPVGGWHWQATDAVNLPQTIYGWAVTDHTDGDTYGSDLFDTPIILTASGQGLNIGTVQFRLPGNFFSQV